MPGKKIDFVFDMQREFVRVAEDELLAWRSGLVFLFELLLEDLPGAADQDQASECPSSALNGPTSDAQAKVRVLEPSKGS